MMTAKTTLIAVGRIVWSDSLFFKNLYFSSKFGGSEKNNISNRKIFLNPIFCTKTLNGTFECLLSRRSIYLTLSRINRYE